MTLSRRKLAFGLCATALLGACANGVGGSGPARIAARADATLADLYAQYPATRDLAAKSTGILVMPLVTEAGLGIGGGYGRGALRIAGDGISHREVR